MKKLSRLKLTQNGELMNEDEMKMIVGGVYGTCSGTSGSCSGICVDEYGTYDCVYVSFGSGPFGTIGCTC